MENNKHIKMEDTSLKQWIQEIPKDSPSPRFTTKVMETVLQQKALQIHYTPLISKRMWGLVAALLFIAFITPFQENSSSWFFNINLNFSFLERMDMTSLFSHFTISTTTFYGVLLLSIMILVQITYLNKYFNRRYGE